MDRVMLSWNIPNLVTVNLMAWAGFLAFVLLFQMIAKKGGKSGTPLTNGAEDIDLGGY